MYPLSKSTYSVLVPNILLSSLSSDISVCSLLEGTDQASHPYKITADILLYITWRHINSALRYYHKFVYKLNRFHWPSVVIPLTEVQLGVFLPEVLPSSVSSTESAPPLPSRLPQRTLRMLQRDQYRVKVSKSYAWPVFRQGRRQTKYRSTASINPPSQLRSSVFSKRRLSEYAWIPQAFEENI